MIRHPHVLEGPTMGDLEHVAEHMREADRREVAAASGLQPLTVLRRGRMASRECYSLRSPWGPPAAIFGVVPMDARPGPRGGVVWLLGTDDMERHALAFHRGMRPQWEAMAQRWGFLTNMVDSRNTVHRRWLEWLGCTFLPPYPMPRSGLPFIPFIKRSNV